MLLQRELVLRHGYLSMALGKHVFCADDVRFWNHSAPCNNVQVLLPGDAEPADVAGRDVATGEELTIDYRTFDAGDGACRAVVAKVSPVPLHGRSRACLGRLGGREWRNHAAPGR